MNKYRKKPIVIEAEQWFPGKEIEGVFEKIDGGSFLIAADETGVFDIAASIETLEGRMLVRKGDWIIRGIENEIYCCKDSVFQKTYEKAEDEEPIPDYEGNYL